jgi:hypothetical protein
VPPAPGLVPRHRRRGQRLPPGRLTILSVPPGAGVAVVRPGRQVLLLWRHRFITGHWGWEVPLGRIEEGYES